MMALDGGSCDGEPDSAADTGFAAFGAEAYERFENTLEVVLRHAGSTVVDDQLDLLLIAGQRN